MRTIKFRGKRLNNGEWVYGSLTQSETHNKNGEPFMVSYIAPFIPVGSECGFELVKMDRVTPTTVGQFTGLTDRNGEEIYEGDILAIEGIKYPRHYIVSWNTEKLMFCIGDTPLYALLEAGNTTMREYIVCGNIHDNHKLLKDEKD